MELFNKVGRFCKKIIIVDHVRRSAFDGGTTLYYVIMLENGIPSERYATDTFIRNSRSTYKIIDRS
jgi:hypothetical protein